MNEGERKFIAEVIANGNVYTAIGQVAPVVGSTYTCNVLVNGFSRLCTTTTVWKAEKLTWDTYIILTMNSLYWVKIKFPHIY